MSRSSSARMPVVYLPHGGGPWPFVDMGFDRREVAELTAYLESLRELAAERPRAVLMISAHWEEPRFTVTTAEHPPLLFDYYGFPPESYALTWPAPGHPGLAARVRELLEGAGIAAGSNAERGYDHGTFVPLKLTYPAADVPVVQLSLRAGLDPREHLAAGRALAPLRDEGVLILGSGMSYHNMRGFNQPRARAASEAFDGWLHATASAPGDARDEALATWTSAPSARDVHPREEHLLPLMVVAGAASGDPASFPFSSTFMGVRISAVHFG